MNNIVMLEENLIDLSLASTPADVLIELESITEKNDLKGKNIKLVLGDVSLTPAHMCGLKSILENSGVGIELICTRSVHTQLAALSAGLSVSEYIPEEITQNEVIQEINESISIQEIELSLSEVIPEEINNIFEETEMTAVEVYETEKAAENVVSEIVEMKPRNASDSRIKTLYLRQTLRSGQTVSFDGNVVIIGDCNPGSEIIASGDITVWGILGGIAHAGAQGNASSCIRALKISAIQLRIADLFARKPDRLELEKVERISTFTPEEARICDGEIIIYALNSSR